jgi:hypothetical protein
MLTSPYLKFAQALLPAMIMFTFLLICRLYIQHRYIRLLFRS